MTENGQTKNNELRKLEEELQEMKDLHKSLWDTYGSELCAGEMIAEENALEKKIKELKLKEEIIKKWEDSGLLEGLDGDFNKNIAKIFENQQNYIIKEGEEDDGMDS